MLDPEKAALCFTLLSRISGGLAHLGETVGAIAHDLNDAIKALSELLDDREQDYSAGLDN
jgi:hypothetical protein